MIALGVMTSLEWWSARAENDEGMVDIDVMIGE